ASAHEPLDRAIDAYAHRRYAEAVALCDEALAIDPQLGRAHGYRALASFDQVVAGLKASFTELIAVDASIKAGLSSARDRDSAKTRVVAVFDGIAGPIGTFAESLERALQIAPSLQK